MGNCYALYRPSRYFCIKATMDKHQKVLRVVKMDGKIMKFKAPILVEDLLVNFSCMGVGVSQEASRLLPLNYELKIGKVYYLLPSLDSVGTISPAGVSPKIEAEQSRGVKRIKVVITKQQLQQLLSKQVSIEEVLSGLQKRTCSPTVSSTNWKPKLDSIPEGRE